MALPFSLHARTPVAFALALFVATSSVAQDAPAVFQRSKGSVLVVESKTVSGGTVQGSAVRIGDASFVTNCHVVGTGQSILVRQGADEATAALLHSDPERDLCIIAAPELLPGPKLQVRDSRTVAVGERVFALGAPRGLELSLSEGLVSARRESPEGSYIQTTAPISPGSSGGALLDTHGRLIGITSFQRKDSQNLNFAAPAEWIAEVPARSRPIELNTNAPEVIKLLCVGTVSSNHPVDVGVHGGSTWSETLKIELKPSVPEMYMPGFMPHVRFDKDTNAFLNPPWKKPFPLTAVGDLLLHDSVKDRSDISGPDTTTLSMRLDRRTGTLQRTEKEMRMRFDKGTSVDYQTHGTYGCTIAPRRQF